MSFFELKFSIFRPNAFDKLVYEELKKIPYGQTKTYREIAVSIGKPNSAMAVANACECNP